jgi:hypothetical protein
MSYEQQASRLLWGIETSIGLSAEWCCSASDYLEELNLPGTSKFKLEPLQLPLRMKHIIFFPKYLFLLLASRLPMRKLKLSSLCVNAPHRRFQTSFEELKHPNNLRSELQARLQTTYENWNDTAMSRKLRSRLRFQTTYEIWNDARSRTPCLLLRRFQTTYVELKLGGTKSHGRLGNAASRLPMRIETKQRTSQGRQREASRLLWGNETR